MWGWVFVSESKTPEKADNEALDELATLRAQHTLSSSSSKESLARTRDRLNEMLYFFENLEHYEKCAGIKKVLDKLL